MITILLADDHSLFRRGLRSMLEIEPDFQVVGEAEDGLAAIAQAQALQPDLVLLDINMPKMNGITAASELRRLVPRTAIVMITMFAEQEIIDRAMAAGAHGYLRKDSPIDEILTTVRRTVATHSVSEPGTPQVAAVPTQVSNRDLLALVMGGMSDSAIAAQVQIPAAEVQARLARLYQVLGVRDRTQAAIYAITQGLDNVPDD